jgi:glycosyltransferase involved in cell wall biosynthesis
LSPAAIDILYVITDLKVGGVPLHLLRLAGAMMARGYRCAVVSLSAEMPLAGRFREAGVEVHGCEGRGGWDISVIGRLARIIKETRPGMVHSLLFHANVAARRAARKVGLPTDRVICEIQTVEVERRWHLLVDRWTHRGCRFTIGNSPSVIEHLAVKAGIPRDRLRLVCGGIDRGPLREAVPIGRAALGVAGDLPIVLWAGRLDPVKGLSILVEAFRSVIADCDAYLLLAGEGPLREALDRQIMDRGLTERVHLLGARDDIPGLLKAADVFVFPSRTEGLPNALLEAMAAGCPIVATDVPGCRDLVTDGDTGLLVPYDDTEALSGAITGLLRDRELATRLGRRAREVAGSEWNIERTWEGYAAIYESILGSRGGQVGQPVSTP